MNKQKLQDGDHEYIANICECSKSYVRRVLNPENDAKSVLAINIRNTAKALIANRVKFEADQKAQIQAQQADSENCEILESCS